MVPTELAVDQGGFGSFPTFISVSLIDALAMVTLAVVIVGVLFRYTLWRRFAPRGLLRRLGASLGSLVFIRVFFSELINRVLLQRDLINHDGKRLAAHLCVFWGFIGLGVTTTLDYIYNQPGNHMPLLGSSLSPIRLLGNLSGVVMLVGLVVIIGRLVGSPEYRRRVTFSDLWFTSILFVAGATGFISEYLGDLAYYANPGVPPAAEYSISLSASPLIIIPYGVHIAAIGLLFITAPLSAFMHALTTPSLRYVDKLGNVLAAKTKSPLNEHKLLKERSMIEQVKELYEG